MNRKKRYKFLYIVLTLSPCIYAQENSWNGTVLGFEQPGEGLFGEMLGIRPILTEHGFNYNLAYLNQLAYNLDGGYDTDGHVAYIDQTALTFTQDLEALTGIPDARIEGNIVNRNHNDLLTTARLQDTRVNFNDLSQESWGGQSSTRLGWLTFFRSFDDGRLNWRIGMFNKVQTFDSILPCDFQLLTQCGGKSAFSLTWNNWNVHTWGTSIEYKLTPELTLKTGILEQNPDASSRGQAWSWSTKGSKGILLPVEMESRTFINSLPGIYNFGILYTNAKQTDLYNGKSGGPGATDPEGYKEYDNTWFFYGGFNQQITQHSDDPNRGMSVALSASVSDQRSNYMHVISAAQIRYRGLFDARPNDWIGLGLSYIDTSNSYAQNQDYKNKINGISDYTKPGYNPVPGDSVNTEVYYRFRPLSWIELQPGIQYWHNPGGLSETRDAWVSAMKTVIVF